MPLLQSSSPAIPFLDHLLRRSNLKSPSSQDRRRFNHRKPLKTTGNHHRHSHHSPVGATGFLNKLLLDNYTGTGFQSKGSYLFGHFSMQIKMVPGDSAGTITAFYLSSQNSEHDEIDFEFLGKRTGQPYILQTNVFTGGKGDREKRIYLWVDPAKAYHS